MTRSHAIATSFFTVLDRTKRPAPGRRCNYTDAGFGAFDRFWAGSMGGWRPVIRWRRS